MELSKYQQERRRKLVRKAVALYKKGYTTREVGRMLARSHAWVAYVVKPELSPTK
jgi:transposase-like protein